MWLTLWDHSFPGSSVHGIFQALECVAMSSSRGSSPPKDWTQISYVSCIGFTASATWEALYIQNSVHLNEIDYDDYFLKLHRTQYIIFESQISLLKSLGLQRWISTYPFFPDMNKTFRKKRETICDLMTEQICSRIYCMGKKNIIGLTEIDFT